MTRSPDELLEALQGFLVDGDRLTAVLPLATGHSNETYLLEGLDLILRMPPSAAPLVISGHAVSTQFELYAALSRLAGGPPVPGVSLLHRDEGVLGAPFFLMERLHGEDAIGDYGPAGWFAEADPGVRGSVARQWIEAVARTNAAAPLDVLGAPVDNASELERWHSLARTADAEAVLEVFDRLVATTPATAAPAVVHGDAKPANTLWRDGELVALLDWEMSFNGDPRWDLGYMLIFPASEQHAAYPGCDLAGVWGREQLMTAWSETTGRSPRDALWFEAASTAKVCSLLSYGHHLVATGQSDDERMGDWGPFAARIAEQAAAVLRAMGRDSGR